MAPSFRRLLRYLLPLLVLVTLAGSLALTRHYHALGEGEMERAREHGRESAARMVALLEREMADIPHLAQALAADLACAYIDDGRDGHHGEGEGEPAEHRHAELEVEADGGAAQDCGAGEGWNAERLEARLERVMYAHSGIFGAGVAFEPYAFDASLRLYAPYLVRNGRQRLEVKYLDDRYDYTEARYDWYHGPMREGARWNEPYFGQTSGRHIAEYTVPVVRDGERVGLVFITTDLAALQRKVESEEMGGDGYAVVTASNGHLVAYPMADYVKEGRKVSDLSGAGSEGVRRATERALAGERGELGYVSEISQRFSWIHYERAPTTGWAVMTVFPERPALRTDQPRYRVLMWLICAWLATAMLLLGVVLMRRGPPTKTRMWVISWCGALLLLGATGALWVLVLEALPAPVDREASSITDRGDLQSFKRDYTRETLLSRRDPPLYIPTGFFVQSVEFSSANNVVLTGYVWQRYASGGDEEIDRGVVMPEAESLDMEEAYRRLEGDEEVIGWYFRVTLRQNFDYTHYPFDRQAVWIRMWHKDFDRNVVLVPDLDAYDRLTPEWLPGIEQDFVLTGWNLTRSYFDYRHNSYNTNFGIDDYVGKSRFPELYFNIGLKRSFLDPFVSSMAPVLVVLLMVFAVQITISRDGERMDLLGFNASTVIAANSALFFVVLLSHIDLRSGFAAREIIYLEEFYFIAYLALLVVSVDAILFSWKRPYRFIDYADNLIPKLLYWPLISVLTFAVTLGTFYP